MVGGSAAMNASSPVARSGEDVLSTTEPVPNSPVRFVDFPIDEAMPAAPASIRARVVLLILLATTVVGIVFALIRGLPDAPLVWLFGGLVTIGLVPVGMILIVRRIVRSRALRACTDAGGVGVQYVLSQVVDATGRLDPLFGLRVATEFFAKAGMQGVAVRLCSRNKVDAIAPLTVPFEPLPLNEAAGSVHELVFTFRERFSARESRAVAPCSRSLRRRVQLMGGWVVLVIIVVQLMNIVAQLIMNPQMLKDGIEWRGVVTVCLVLVIAILAMKRCEFLVTPGGLICRCGSWLQRNWKTELYRREEAMLLVAQVNRTQWELHVFNRHAARRRSITRQEAAFVLRAWLSPLTPPTQERIGDWQ